MHEAKILIVDDEQLICDSLVRELSQEGYHVTGAANGKEAVKRLQNEHYDLVLTDLVMPELDGIELLREIKQTAPETSVIIFTGYGDMHSVIEALRLGAADYLLKPCDTGELLFRVSLCLEKRGLLRQLTEQNNKLREEMARRQRLEEELREQAKKITLFSHSIVHDIKVPAISIHGLINLFIKKFKVFLPEKGHQYCTQILRAVEQIVTLVDQMNRYLSAKESPLKIESVSLKEIVALIREEFSVQLDARRIQWVVPVKLPTIRADRTALMRVIRNCIDNALKYGGETLGEIAIHYKQTPGFHVLSVSNDGVSMTRDECETIFELFRREKSSQGIQGTGLGLAIVKEIMLRHKGGVRAEPYGEKGVVFHMSIAKDL